MTFKTNAKEMTDAEFRAARAAIRDGRFQFTPPEPPKAPDKPTLPDARQMTEAEYREYRRGMHVDTTRGIS